MAKRLLLLGSTGSIGRQVLDVCARLGDRVELVGVAARRSVEELCRQARDWNVGWAALAEERADQADLPSGCRFRTGPEALAELAAEVDYDMLVVSVSGMIGLRPTLIALDRGKEVALASKEVLVAGGRLVAAAAGGSGRILPIDSEHSAVFQCVQGVPREHLAEVILTASGGPFRGWRHAELERVTPEIALHHPTWRMGPKITIDSATLMNKGLEVIEAHWLFGLPPERISVIIHPQSILHSIIRLVDGSMLSQMGLPDMRMPIQVALLHPERVDTGLEPVDLARCRDLTFEEVDREVFPCLGLAYEALRVGGTMPAAMNGANEAAVPMFLDGRIGFMDIPRIVEKVMREHEPVEPTLDAVIEADAWARGVAERVAGAKVART
jgi:1-deoxy-D-xylulose-5-phosphate reductoisomerase